MKSGDVDTIINLCWNLVAFYQINLGVGNIVTYHSEADDNVTESNLKSWLSEHDVHLDDFSPESFQPSVVGPLFQALQPDLEADPSTV